MTTSAHPLQDTKILFFDCFGTVVDWRSSVTRYLHTSAVVAQSLLPPTSIPSRALSMTRADWGAFASAWRDSYYTFVRGFAALPAGEAPYTNIDVHHAKSLRELLATWHLEGLWDEATIDSISRVWHALEGWADSSDGLAAMREKGYAVSTLSNGNVTLLEDMARFAGLPWTYVTSAEQFGSYKPNPAVYRGAARLRGFGVEQCAMVAAHLGDLQAAKGCGFKTVYVERMQEEGWKDDMVAEARRTAGTEDGFVDVWVSLGEDGFMEVARRLPGVKAA